jgi:hypothetical protein
MARHVSIVPLARAFAVAIAMVAIILLTAGPATATPPITAPVVQNGAQPSQGVRTLELEELWRRGGEDDEEIFFGLINQIAVDEEQNVYLLDGQLSQVPVFDRDGELVDILSREGDGPGETRRPGDLFLTDDGRIGLAVTFPGRVVFIDRNGEPAGTLSIGSADPASGGFSLVRTARGQGDRCVLGCTSVSTDQAAGRQVRTPRVAAYDADGSVAQIYHESSYVIDFSEQTFYEATQIEVPLRRVAVGPDGRVYVAGARDEYRIDVFESDGTPVHTIRRDYPVHRRTEAELEEWRRLFAASMRNVPFDVAIDLCENAAPIDWVFGGLWVRDDGRLWVRTSRSALDQPEGVMLTYDVFDTDGRFAEQVQVRCPGDGEEDALFFAGPDRLILVRGFMDAVRAMFGGVEGHEGDEAEPMAVVCFAVK